MAIEHASIAVPPIRAIALILANAILRLQHRQKQLAKVTRQSVHTGSCQPPETPHD